MIRMKTAALATALTVLASVSTLSAQTAASIPADYPQSSAVIADVKANKEVATGLSGLGLAIAKATKITVIDFVPEKIDIPSGWPANTVTMKAFIDFPKESDGNFKRVHAALIYRRTVTETSTGPWKYSAVAQNISWFDEAHLIAPDGTDLTHQKRVKEQADKDAAAQAERNAAKAGNNAPTPAQMKSIALEGAGKKPKDVFDHDYAKIKIIDVVLDEKGGFTSTGTIGSYRAEILYEFGGAKYSQKVKVQSRRADENAPWSAGTVKGEGSAKKQ